jgi:hypothetical protein
LSYGQPQHGKVNQKFLIREQKLVNIFGNQNLQYNQNQNQEQQFQQNGGFHQEVKNEPEPEEVKLEDDPHFQKCKPIITISNVVSNFRCRCHLNLRLIAAKTKHVVYKR